MGGVRVARFLERIKKGRPYSDPQPQERSNELSMQSIAELPVTGKNQATFRKQLRWNISQPPPGSIVMTVTPAMAEIMLEHNEADDDWQNRAKSAIRVERYSAAMKKEWKLTGEPIIFSVCGRMLNGQHRCWGCIESGVPFTTDVRFGIEDDAFAFMDIGYLRNAGMIFSNHGVYNAKAAAAVASLIYRYKHAKAMGSLAGSAIPSHNELFELYNESAGIQESVHMGARIRKSKLMSAAWGGFLHYLFSTKHRGLADEFFETLISGLGLKKGDPENTLRNRLLKSAMSADDLPKITVGAFSVMAWNAKRQNKPIQILRWRGEQKPNEAFPRAI